MFKAVSYITVMVSLTIGHCSGQSPELETPVCSRFDWDYKVLQKLSDLDSEIKALKTKVSTLKTLETEAGECKDRWIPWEGKCYYFLAQLKTFDSAQLCSGGQCTYPYFPGVSFTSTPLNILSNPLAAFPHNHRRNAYCKNHGGKLAEPPTRSANEFLKQMAFQFKQENWWIGLSDEKNEGQWVWLSSGKSPNYSDWKQGNPNQGRECNCGGLWYRYEYGWVDEPCSYRYNAICEI